MAQFSKDYAGGFVDGPAGGTPITGAVMSNIENGIVNEDVTNQFSPAHAYLFWTASTNYTAGQPVISPNGDLVTAKSTHTSGSTYTPANWVSNVTINVKSVGAHGDGITDDRAAIQLALDIAGVGGSVYFPPGTYLLTSATQPGDRILKTYQNQTLYGQSKMSSVLKVSNSFGDYMTVIGMANDSTYAGRWIISNLGINQNATNGNALNVPAMSTYARMALRLGSNTAGSSITVSDCAFMDSDTVNTVYVYADTIELRGNLFLDQGGPVATTTTHDHSTVYLSTPLQYGTQAVVGNTFRGVVSSPGARTAIETHGGAQTITGNTVSAYAQGMNLTGINSYFPTNGITCTGNLMTHVCIGLHVWAQYAGSVTTGAALQNVILTGNSITIDRDAWSGISSFLPYGHGVIIDSGNNAPIDGLNISNNNILYLPSTATPPVTDRHSTGINIEVSSTAAEIRNFQISGNVITAPLSAGGLLSGTLKRGSIKDNIVVDPAQSTEATVVAAYRAGWTLGGTMEDVKFQNNLLVDTRATHYAVYNINVLSTLTVATNCEAIDNKTRFVDGASPNCSFIPSSVNTSGTEFFVIETNALGATPFYNTKAGSTIRVSGSGRVLTQVTSPVGATWKQAMAVGATTATTAPAAGAAAALPATPTGYITLNVNGTDRQIAYY